MCFRSQKFLGYIYNKNNWHYLHPDFYLASRNKTALSVLVTHILFPILYHDINCNKGWLQGFKIHERRVLRNISRVKYSCWLASNTFRVTVQIIKITLTKYIQSRIQFSIPLYCMSQAFESHSTSFTTYEVAKFININIMNSLITLSPPIHSYTRDIHFC